MMDLAPPNDLPALAAASAQIGADPLLIQGPGGNTSIKEGGGLWIKASGTNLADALTRDVFVPCDLEAMRSAVAEGQARADQPAEFALVSGGLRPSIETSLHAVFAQRIVIHVHCVNTLAFAVRPDAKEALTARLADFDWAIVPYAKPGARLAEQVRAVLGPRTDVVVLANHGLIVAGETVAATMDLLGRVVAAVTVAPRVHLPGPDIVANEGGGYHALPPDHPLHCVAMSPDLLAIALSGSLYPDHVIFCGIGATALAPRQTPAEAARLAAKAGLPAPAFLLVPGAGALLHEAASDGARALARCLGDVLTRLSPGASVRSLSMAENAELLNWDAEKYRQALNAR